MTAISLNNQQGKEPQVRRKPLRLFAFDRLTIVTTLFCLVLYGPLSLPLFSVGGAYAAEAPIAIIGAIIFVAARRQDRGAAIGSLKRAIPLLATVALFGLLGIYNGASFMDVYSDLRAITACIISIYIIFKFDDDRAIRVILISFIINLVLYAIFIMADMGPFIFSESTFASGKLSLPTFAIIFGTLYVSGQSRILFIISAACLLIIGSSTSLRYIYVLFCYLIIVGAGFAAFGIRSKVARVAHSLSVFALALIATIVVISVDFVRVLMQLEHWARDLGVGEQIIHQVLVKTAQNLTSGLNYGDEMYLQFATHLLDIERFLLPHGLGHEASIGQEIIFGANTIDNSIIFLHYHFGIIVSFFLLWLAVRFFFRLVRGQSFSSTIVIILFVAPLAAAFYMRAIAFTEVGAAISFAMALRGLQVLANDLRKTTRGVREVPRDAVAVDYRVAKSTSI